MRHPLFVPAKRDYVRGARPRVDCILCSVRDRDAKVARLVVAEDRNFLVSLNLFPYNPGHLLGFHRRHIEDFLHLTAREVRALDRWTRRILDDLDAEYEPAGYNIGFNLGRPAGASIGHLHLHIVPRFPNEVGFIDVIGGARVHVDDPAAAARRLRKRFAPPRTGER